MIHSGQIVLKIPGFRHLKGAEERRLTVHFDSVRGEEHLIF